jgi:hypothetical protein
VIVPQNATLPTEGTIPLDGNATQIELVHGNGDTAEPMGIVDVPRAPVGERHLKVRIDPSGRVTVVVGAHGNWEPVELQGPLGKPSVDNPSSPEKTTNPHDLWKRFLAR